MTSKFKQPRPAYHSYLIRCWTTPALPNDGVPDHQRFVVETISDPPRRRGFDSLADMLDFLHSELAGEDEPMKGDGLP
jgi:hypothetical protein